MTERPPDTSLGFECCEFAEDVLGIDLLPWQRWFLIHALELVDPDRLPDDFDASTDFDSVADSVHRSRPAHNLGVDSGAPGD